MRISPKHIAALQRLLKEQFGLNYTDEQAQHAGLAIMRFVIAKELRVKSREKPSKRTPNEI